MGVTALIWWHLKLMGAILIAFLVVAQMPLMAEASLIEEVSSYNQTQEVVTSDFLVQA